MNPPSGGAPEYGVRWAGQTAVVAVAGDIDLSRSVEFQQQLLLLLDRRPQRLVVNLTGVPYMDSSGVASLVKVLARARKIGASLVLVGLMPRVKSLFEITRLDKVFTLAPTEEEAMGKP